MALSTTDDVAAATDLRPREAVAQPARSAPFLVLATIIVGGTLLLPLAMMLGAASIARLLYPVYALALVLLVLARWPASYPAVCLGVSAFAPFLRRIADFHAGFQLTSPVLLAPLVVLLPTLLALLRRILTPGGALSGAFAVMTACISYGAVLALVEGKLIQGLYEPAWWLLPPALAAYVIERRAEVDAIRRSVIWALLIILPIITVYGVIQFASPAAWDIVWMLNVDNATFGRPAPYEVRVFSMLNSPGICAVFVAYAMILLSGEGILGLLVSMATLPLLMLTLLRAGWVAFAIGVLTTILLARTVQRVRLAVALAAGVFLATGLLASTLVPVTVTNLLTDRVGSLFALGTDASASDRRDTYASFFDRLAISPMGEGFGANGSATSAAQKRDLPALDSGILETYLTLGIPVGTIYFGSLVVIVLAAWRGLLASDRSLANYFALVCAVVAITPLGLSHVGEAAPIQWIAVGILVSAWLNRAADPSRYPVNNLA